MMSYFKWWLILPALLMACMPPTDVKSSRTSVGLPDLPNIYSSIKRYEAEDALSPGKGTQASKIAVLIDDKDASGGKALRFATTSPAPVGYVVMWGPYETLPAGDYVAIYRLKVSDNNFVMPMLALQVTAQNAQQASPQVISKIDLIGKSFPEQERYFLFTLPFRLDGEARVEMRILWYTLTDLDVDYRSIATPLP